ncbi:MAG: hypothetical protein WC301_04520 [Candidatus Omnitrophota bacterium]|jgi:hypothetical protein
MKHKIRKFIVAAIIISAIYSALAYKDILIRSFVATTATQIIGANVTIQGLSFDMLDSSIHIKGLKVYNPEGFPREVFLDIPKIEVEYDLSALLKKDLHLVSAEIVLKEIVVIKDKQGRLNVNALKTDQKKKGLQDEAGPGTRKVMPMRIDFLKLDIGRLVNKDLSRGDKPVLHAYNINIKKAYKNITGVRQLMNLMLVESLKPAAIKGAQIYGVTALAGAVALPVGVASALIIQDSAKAVFEVSYEKAYQVSLDAADELGDIIKADQRQGYIKCRIQGIDVVVRVSKGPDNRINISVSARKYIFPRLKTAEGLLYEISRKLKIAP